MIQKNLWEKNFVTPNSSTKLSPMMMIRIRYIYIPYNYKCCLRKYEKQQSVPVPQMSFHAHFAQEGHNGIGDWSFTLIDQAHDISSLRRRKEAYWQNVLNTFQPHGLNERDVTLIDYGWFLFGFFCFFTCLLCSMEYVCCVCVHKRTVPVSLTYSAGGEVCMCW